MLKNGIKDEFGNIEYKINNINQLANEDLELIKNNHHIIININNCNRIDLLLFMIDNIVYFNNNYIKSLLNEIKQIKKDKEYNILDRNIYPALFSIPEKDIIFES